MHYLLNLEMFKIYTNIAFHQHKLLITEQQVRDINPLYELADMSRIPLQKNIPWLSLILHSTQHTRHPKVNLAHIFTCLTAYLFAFYIYNLYLFVYILKKHLSIADMLPHYHITCKDIILPSVLI
jgi:hypothetical protein